MKKGQPTTFIQVVIPYEPACKVGYAYNRAMEKADDWCLILDHDLFICNPNWYEISLAAIEKVGHKAGWITGVANRNAPGCQKDHNAPSNDNLVDHIKYGEQLWNKHRLELVEYSSFEFCGFFILTHKQAWLNVGKFRTDKCFVDGDYSKALFKAGYKGYVVPGLYFYHLENAKSNVWKGRYKVDFGHPFSIKGFIKQSEK